MSQNRLSITFYLHDAVYLYLRTVNQTLADGYTDYKDGRFMRNRTIGQRFTGEFLTPVELFVDAKCNWLRQGKKDFGELVIELLVNWFAQNQGYCTGRWNPDTILVRPGTSTLRPSTVNFKTLPSPLETSCYNNKSQLLYYVKTSLLCSQNTGWISINLRPRDHVWSNYIDFQFASECSTNSIWWCMGRCKKMQHLKFLTLYSKNTISQYTGLRKLESEAKDQGWMFWFFVSYRCSDGTRHTIESACTLDTELWQVSVGTYW